jgi:hypothetical protein
MHAEFSKGTFTHAFFRTAMGLSLFVRFPTKLGSYKDALQTHELTEYGNSSLIDYSMFHQFRQAELVYGGSILTLSQF